MSTLDLTPSCVTCLDGRNDSPLSILLLFLWNVPGLDSTMVAAMRFLGDALTICKAQYVCKCATAFDSGKSTGGT